MSKRLFLGWFLLASMAAGWSVGCDDTKLNTIDRIPVSVQITVSPWLDRYARGDVVELDYVVLDVDGIVLADLPATWTKPTADRVQDLGAGRYELLSEGEHTWRVTLDAPFGNVSSSVTLRVTGAPASLVITVDPEQEYYRVNQQVTLGFEVRDADGILIENLAATWHDPGGAGVVSLGNQQFQFAAAGVYTWRVVLEPPYGLSAERSLEVDDAGPGLLLLTPERGDTLLKDTVENSVSVQGTVTDDMSAVESLTLTMNGGEAVLVTVQANGAFTQLMSVTPGVNLLVATAIDSAGNVNTVTRGFHYAPDFFAYQNDMHGRDRVPERLHGLLTDRALDRGTPPGYDPCGYDGNGVFGCDPLADVASLMEIGLNMIAFEDLPEPYTRVWPLFTPYTNGFTFPGVSGSVEVSVNVTGEFILELGFSDIGVGQAKVDRLASKDYAVDGDIDFSTFTAPGGEVFSGLYADLGLTGQLVFAVTLNLVADNPTDQAIACFAATVICDGGNCLDDYLPACVGAGALPALSSVSTISTPVLVGFDIDELHVDAEWSVYLDANDEPLVSLSSMDLAFGSGGLDLSVLSGFDVELGVVELFGYQIADLGTYTLEFAFLQDIADALFNPLMDMILPIVEPFIGQFFSCSDTDNPLCFVIPFFENLFDTWTTDGVLEMPDLFDPQAVPVAAEVNLLTNFDDLHFLTGVGARMALGGRIDSTTSPALASHSDDDHLGLALIDGCSQTPESGLATWPSSTGQAMQSLPAFDLFNMLLFAAWNAGAFDLAGLGDTEIDLSGQAVSGLTLNLKPWLSPLLVADCPTNEEPTIWAGWADMGVDGQFTRNGAVFAFDGFVGLKQPGILSGNAIRGLLFTASDGVQTTCELSLNVDGAMADEAELAFACDLLTQRILGDVLSRAVGQVLASADLFVPVYDLSPWPGAPAGSVLGISTWEVSSEQGRAFIRGDF